MSDAEQVERDAETRAAAEELVRAEGIPSAARKLGVSRGGLVAVLAGHASRGTMAAVRESLRELRGTGRRRKTASGEGA